jgi:hypothetical protein
MFKELIELFFMVIFLGWLVWFGEKTLKEIDRKFGQKHGRV